MPTPDIERLEQHLAANPWLRQAIVFGSMAAGMARADRQILPLRRRIQDQRRRAWIRM